MLTLAQRLGVAPVIYRMPPLPPLNLVPVPGESPVEAYGWAEPEDLTEDQQ